MLRLIKNQKNQYTKMKFQKILNLKDLKNLQIITRWLNQNEDKLYCNKQSLLNSNMLIPKSQIKMSSLKAKVLNNRIQ